ncbi:TetR/AcrR family transcriptional regulator [Glaciihabitans sp. dw_435]|uniref:TetR/AcrR family transcriptional regulator n=1 Tax=Glaciihabitans sp. dw_435 TaxID=2720081 RepID=UPI002107C20E|nr:TetR/AcrR family transcriptional regulator [Glaciihabitans sp. dw_435]
MSDAPALGLRERKRIATRRAIQRAVLRLASERGLEQLTIEDISREADVSPRTFFNYFGSKDAAVIGDAPDLPNDASVERFITAGPGADLMDGIRELMVEGVETALEDRVETRQRRELHKQYPHLFAQRMANMRQFENALASIVEQRLAQDDPALAQDAEALASRARLITLVAIAALRHAWSLWADGESSEGLPEQMRDSFAELESLLVSARP